MARVLQFAKPAYAQPVPLRDLAARPLLGDLLVETGALEAGHLAEALEAQREQDQHLGRILLANRQISPEALVAALSQQSGLGRIDLAVSPPDRDLLRGLDPYTCLALGAVPWRHVGGTRVIAVSSPQKARAAMQMLGGGAERIALALADPEAIRRAVIETCKSRLRDDASSRCPERYSCRGWLGGRRNGRSMALAALVLAGVAAAPLLALQMVMAWILVVNAMTMGLRLVAIFARFTRKPERLPDALRLADYKKLPKVSILVPLLREEAVAQRLLEALAAMDYPPALLDIKLVLEEDDTITRAAIDRTDLPATIEVVSVPADSLKTKPRAMNYALPFCEGEIIGVYDAEDRPDRNQIREVVQHLQNAGPEVACVQGYLDFYNTDRNWLSRCFTLEYAIWFRVILHGVQRLGFPIPLGGTTVFFRRSVLEEIGAWDAHNVTEDADLGMRLARFGYRCEMIATTTWEEANFRVLPWIKQRSRWLKGYAITWASHMRNPASLWRDLGPRGFWGFQVLFLGAITSYLAMPLFWLIWASSAGLGLGFWQSFPAPLMWGFFASMFLGQAVMLATAVIAAIDTRRLALLPWVLALPLYWPLGAIAAYRAVAEAFYAPFYWHKTEHGVEATKARRRLRRAVPHRA